MGGVYSAEDMEKQMLALHLQNIQKRERNGYHPQGGYHPPHSPMNRARRPFKLIRDNATQTDVEVPEQRGCSCSNDIKPKKEAKIPDESHINFTSIYLSCNNAPTKGFCDSFVQTEPVSVHSRGVQVGAGLENDDYDNLTEDSPIPWTSESSDGGRGSNHQRRRRRRQNASTSTQKQIESVAEHTIDTKYISSFSDDEDDDDDESLCLDASPDHGYTLGYDYERNLTSLNHEQLDDGLNGSKVIGYPNATCYYDNNESDSGYHAPTVSSTDQDVSLSSSPLRQLSAWRQFAANNVSRMESGSAGVGMKSKESNVLTWKKYLSGEGVTNDDCDDEEKPNNQKCNDDDEFEIRHMLDVDYCWKCECLQQENSNMELMVAQYQHVIKELSERREDLMLNDASLNDTLLEKEQLQMDLNRAENSLMDAYNRIERLKTMVEKYKHNEDSMKVAVYDFQTKLSKSEGRYKKFKKHAIEKVDAANKEISRIHHEKESELSEIRAELKRCRERNKNLELELKEKAETNEELSQICDELIKKVSSD